MRRYFTFFLLLAFSHNCYSQIKDDTLSIEEVFFNFKKLTRKAEVKYNINDTIYPKIVQLEKIGDTLIENLISSSLKYDSMYVLAISRDNIILESILSDSINVDLKLKYLINNFSLRLSYSILFGFTNAPITEIEVVIYVKKGGVDQIGYTIGCNTLFWFDKDPIKFASGDSSPTTIFLPPGEYIFYVKKKGQTISTSQRTIGNQKLDLKQVIIINI